MRRFQFLITFVGFLLGLTLNSYAYAAAGGGQHAVSNPVIVPSEGCVPVVAEEVNLTACQLTTAPDQAGITVYKCNVTYYCSEEAPEYSDSQTEETSDAEGGGEYFARIRRGF